MRKLGINWARFSVRSVEFNKDAIE
jgi:hypothetical protein